MFYQLVHCARWLVEAGGQWRACTPLCIARSGPGGICPTDTRAVNEPSRSFTVPDEGPYFGLLRRKDHNQSTALRIFADPTTRQSDSNDHCFGVSISGLLAMFKRLISIVSY